MRDHKGQRPAAAQSRRARRNVYREHRGRESAQDYGSRWCVCEQLYRAPETAREPVPSADSPKETV